MDGQPVRRSPSPPAPPAGVRPKPIVGLGVSPGIVEGVAHVIADPTEPSDFEPGDILVCHATDPSWASLFLLASGVVIDIGGMLSHGAIVARELGIPCVINTGSGTQRLHSGDRIRIDGTAGAVTLLSRGPVSDYCRCCTACASGAWPMRTRWGGVTGLTPAEAAALAAGLSESGLAVSRTGRFAGWALTARGTAALRVPPGRASATGRAPTPAS